MHGDAWARELQFGIWSRWTMARRLAAMGRMTATVLALRDRHLRELHPHATDEEFRRIRIQATLDASPTQRLP